MTTSPVSSPSYQPIGSLRSRLADYYNLPLWREYLVALGKWEAAHSAYCAAASLSPAEIGERRVAMQSAASVKDGMLARLRSTPEHFTAFGWN
jgi:hypothetical protein